MQDHPAAIDVAGAMDGQMPSLEDLARMKEKQREQIEALAAVLNRKRDDAISARSGLGIEQDWSEDEDAYNGIDDANRGESGRTATTKPAAINGAFIPRRDLTAGRSTAFLNITRPYVDSASARMADMLLPTDDRNWMIRHTPIPELSRIVDQAAEQKQAPQPQQMPPPGVPMPPMPAPGMGIPGMPPGMQPPQVTPDQAIQVLKQAKDQAEKAQTQIDDWLVECGYNAEVRKVIEDCARLGTGILKGPEPYRQKSKRVMQMAGAVALAIEIKIAPRSRRVDPWNFFPDPSCGECIQDGNFVFERDTLTARQLKELRGVPGYLDEAIDAAIEEGPQSQRYGKRINDKVQDKEIFEVWYYYGAISKSDMSAMGVDVGEDARDSIDAIVTLVNDRPIKAAVSPLDGGGFPYDLMVWQRRAGMPWGNGVSRQIATPQKMVNAAARNMLENAGLSAGGQLVINEAAVRPADGNWTISPRKIWFVRQSELGSVPPFQLVTFPGMTQDLMAIIQFAMKMAEDVTGLPSMMQGQNTDTPDTVGGMVMLQNAAGTVLRRIARTFDDRITSPHIRRYYEWLMLHGEDESIKGDFVIEARGSAALVERDATNQALLQMGGLVANPVFGIDPKKWFVEACKAQRIDPDSVQMSPEELAQRQQQAQQPQDPRIQVAQINAEAKKAETELQAKVDMQRIKRDMDRDTVFAQQEGERTKITQEQQSMRTQLDHQQNMAELQLRRELAIMDYANKHQMKIEDIKAKLADTAIKVKAQRDLAAADNAITVARTHAKQVAKPAFEPVGRAQPGKSFQQ